MIGHHVSIFKSFRGLCSPSTSDEHDAPSLYYSRYEFHSLGNKRKNKNGHKKAQLMYVCSIDNSTPRVDVGVSAPHSLHHTHIHEHTYIYIYAYIYIHIHIHIHRHPSRSSKPSSMVLGGLRIFTRKKLLDCLCLRVRVYAFLLFRLKDGTAFYPQLNSHHDESAYCVPFSVYSSWRFIGNNHTALFCCCFIFIFSAFTVVRLLSLHFSTRVAH